MGDFLFTGRTWSDYLYWQTQDKKTLKRINALLRDIARGGFDGLGKPVYRVQGDTVQILSCKGHYD